MAISRPGLKRSRDQRIIAGVCGGIAEWLGWNAGVTRLLYVLITLTTGVPAILYLILWIAMPERDRDEF
jgi:phage shock protein PspC (stress-responsive transcriptional regulator)